MSIRINGGGSSGSGGGTPGGSGTQIQYRVDASTFGGITGSSVSGADVILGGVLSVTGNLGMYDSANGIFNYFTYTDTLLSWPMDFQVLGSFSIANMTVTNGIAFGATPASISNNQIVNGTLNLVGYNTSSGTPTNVIQIKNTTSGTPALGFNGTSAIAKPSGNALTALSNLGLITSPTLTSSDVSLGSVTNALQLVKANNLSDLANSTTAQGNLFGVYVTNLSPTYWVTGAGLYSDAGVTTDQSGTWTFTGLKIGSAVVPSISSTNTLTNKRITKRVTTASDSTSVTPNSDNADITYQANTQSVGTLTINADAGTPTNGQSWLLKIKSTNTQTFSWNAVFVGGTTALPTTSTGSSKIDYFSFIYDTVNSKWHFTGTSGGF